MKKYLLIVDDDLKNSELIEELFGSHFTKVFRATTVDEAQTYLKDYKFSFIILEIKINGRNGGEIFKFIHENTDNSNGACPIAIVSGIVTNEFIERNIHRFAGIFTKPFDKDLLNNLILLELEKNKKPEVLPVDEGEQDEIPRYKYDLPFPVEQLEEKVNKILDTFKKNPKVKNLFGQLKINRSPDSFVQTHIGVLINIATGISIQMEWNTEKTLEKFVYAAYLHDIALYNRPDLVRIKDKAQLDSMKDLLGPQDYRLVFDHPNLAAKIIDEIPEIPPDVGLIVRQHHEMPREDGFPAGLSHSKIVPLATIFIVAHDMTHYIFETAEWSVADYVTKAKVKFKGGHFQKVLFALNEMK